MEKPSTDPQPLSPPHTHQTPNSRPLQNALVLKLVLNNLGHWREIRNSEYAFTYGEERDCFDLIENRTFYDIIRPGTKTMIVCPLCTTPSPFTPIFLSDEHIYGFTDGTATAVRYSGIIPAMMPTHNNGIRYALLECQSCNHVFVVKASYHNNDWNAVYPIIHRMSPQEVPTPINQEFEEANLCFAIGAYKACASMCQRVVESICQNKDASNLNELKQRGIISSSLFDRATEIRLWAGVVKHVPLTSESISEEDANQLLTYLELILHAVYVEPERLEELKKKRKSIEKERP